ncbi:uncharacterized protein BP5553_00293 [Venustampulla echinocandica]|uniref:C2H2-type domain-containing protein n=1 Tax=Venustampulla echinocandica TaxID=2656787 RepID=A0A370TXR8_9HELO|nr:uncharacterized protein BP5553_00293 [Venustampulla echinocandica]RDL40314.1 hypothetical protein BP5553_00293 [Venustampulla echinocandica]
MLFDLHLTCKHVGGGLRWYCRHPLCQNVSWAARSTQSVREHEESYHSESTDESYKFCHLRHPESLDEHWPQWRKLRMSYDAMPWLSQNTGEPIHPNFITAIASDALRRSILGQFLCAIELCGEAYTSMRNIVIHQLTTHFNFVMACPIGCGATFATLQTVHDHLEEAHTRSFHLIRDSSPTDVTAIHTLLNSHAFTMSQTARRVKEALVASPNTVFFIDIETTVSCMGQCAEAIEISVIDGNNNVIIDTIVDYGLTIEQMFNLYATPPINDFRYRTLAKVLGPLSEKAVSGRRPEQIIQILYAAGMNKDSFLVDWSMSSYDWDALKRLINRAGDGDAACLPLYSNS